MVSKNMEFRRKRRRLDNPPESDNESNSSGDDAGSSDGAYDELYDTPNEDDDDDDDDDDNQADDDITEPLEEEEHKAPQGKRKFEKVSGAEGSQTKGKKSREHLKVPTTAEEVKRLRETEKLFHSNLYRLQIEETLKEVKVKKKYTAKFEQWFPLLQSYLLEMEDQEHSLGDLQWIETQGVYLPIRQSQTFKGRFVFQRPTSVTLIGSYTDGCALGPKINVDVAVQMPEGMFSKHDFRNEKFHRKRALFLSCITSHLLSSDLILNDDANAPKFLRGYGGDTLMPVLEVTPTGFLTGKARVRIHAFAPPSIFELRNFAPSKNILDPAFFLPDPPTERPATPFHNASTLAALVTPENDAAKSSAIASHQNILDALVLLKIWLRQRSLHQGYTGFGSYVMTMLVVHLIRKRRISPQMSSYQIIRIVWNFLSETDWTKPEDVPSLVKDQADTKVTLEDFCQHYDVVFVDVTGCHNLAYNINATTYYKVKAESRLALQCLDDSSIDSFQALFITPMPFIRQFDHVIRFKHPSHLKSMIKEKATLSQKLDQYVFKERLAADLVLKELQRGLSKRVQQWGIYSDPVQSWDISRKPSNGISLFLIGLNLDPQHAFSIIDKGPAANEPEAEEFRKYWGDKSDLRRFQDGSISEAVVWLDAKASLAQRRVICKSIVSYVLEHRLGLDPENLIYIADQVECTLHRPELKLPDFTYGTGEEATLAVLSAFGRLSKNLRDLKELPLEITEIQGVSPTFRYAEPFPPLASFFVHPNKAPEKGNCLILKQIEKIGSSVLYLPVLEVVVSLGLSSKWPSEVEAVRRIRAAFNIQIAKGLRNSFKLTTQAHPDYVDVVQDGFVFRLRVAYQNEIALLKETKLPDGSVKYRDTSESLALERSILHLPSISGYLHGLHQQSPAFGPTACLAKRWISAQLMIGEHIPEIVIELLVAYIFLHPEPFQTASQPQTAFLRFLHFIGRTNWNTEPIILNFRNAITHEEITEIEKYFKLHRKELPTLFIATPTDHTKSVWTTNAPSLTMLIRLAELAQSALVVLDMPYIEKNHCFGFWHQIFEPDLSPYDIAIRLKKKMISRRNERLRIGSEPNQIKELLPYKKKENEKIPVTNFDLAQLYLRDLRESFGHLALFFYDMYGGDTIGVVWKPDALEPKKISVSQMNGRCLEKGNLVVNRDAAAEDFFIMGKGLVLSVDTLEHASVTEDKELVRRSFDFTLDDDDEQNDDDLLCICSKS